MARPRTEPAEVRRRRILEAAKKNLIGEGYEDILLDDVARDAGIAKGTIYLYYRNKDDLLAAVMADLSQSLQFRLQSLPLDCGSKESLLLMAEGHLDFLDEHKDFLTELLKESPDLHPNARGASAFRKLFKAHLAGVAARFQSCIGRGVMRPHDPRLGALLLFSLLRMFMVRKSLYGLKEPLRAQAPQLVRLLLDGLGAGGGRP
jgi:AcrR family transcriptional regulator